MKCFDLFAGCGGMSLGFANAGFSVVGAIENWDAAIAVYKSNFDHPVFNQNLKDELGSAEIIKGFAPDIIIGGPPCQDFSSAGKRDILGGRADLTYSFANIVCEIRPHVFVMENVDQIRKSHILQEVIEQFQQEGYGLTAVILNAAHCGVPQARTRFFLIGRVGGENNEFLNLFQKSLSQTKMTMRDYFGDKLGVDYYYRHPRNYNRRGIFSMDEPSPTIRGVNRPIPSGYKVNQCDPAVDLSQVRPLTTAERGLVQTFPESFKFHGTKTNLEQIIGNAVPVKLAEFVGRVISQFLSNPMRQLQTDMFDNTVIIPDAALKPV